MLILVGLYFLVNLGLAIYSTHVLLLGILFVLRERRRGEPMPSYPGGSLTAYPTVTVQLPIFNEARVVERLLAAVAALDWPADRLEIQVLDDSTDDTKDLAAHWVAYHQQRGVPIVHLHRTDRSGYKAGALTAGLEQARGEFIALFDADFVPQPDFLLRLMPWLLDDSRRAFVQARWGHLNRNYSLITRLQSVVLDGHFYIDQNVRYWAGLTMHFNGTAGIWRKAAIDDCQGWHHDTLCEDLDLSYRAVLRGWKPCFLVDVVVPAELSPQLQAFRQQQFRWAKGATQCLKKLWPTILRSGLPWWKKLIALVHISGHTINILLMLQVLLGPWVGLCLRPQDMLPLALLGMWNTWSFVFFYVLVLRKIDPTHWRRSAWLDFPLLMLLGVGLSVNNCLALWEGWLGIGGNVFRRTPKFNVVRPGDTWKTSRYRLPVGQTAWIELLMAGYALAGAYLLWSSGAYFLVPLSIFFGLGFLCMACLTLTEAGKR